MEIFDLDGHNLGTVLVPLNPYLQRYLKIPDRINFPFHQLRSAVNRQNNCSIIVRHSAQSNPNSALKIISFIEDKQIVKKILRHLDLWDVRRKAPACANSLPPETFIIYDESSWPSTDDYIIDTDYSIGIYL